jgi:hypothetical protein
MLMDNVKEVKAAKLTKKREREIEKAKEFLREYYWNEFEMTSEECESSFSDLENVPLAYTTLTNLFPIEVFS